MPTSVDPVPPRRRPGPVANSLAASRLGTCSIVFFTIAAAAPETVVGGGAVSGFAVSGVNGIPVGYLAIAGVLGLFAIGYVTMARHVENAGAFYAYIARGLGRVPGTAAGGVAVLAYNLVQVSLVGGFGVGAASFVRQAGGPALPWWLFAAFGVGLVALLSLLRIDANGRILGVLLLAEIAIILLYDLAFVSDPAEPGASLTTLHPAQLGTGAAGVILVIAFTGFIGFENSTVLAEEARDPRTVRRATYASLVVIGLLYGTSTWALTVATGPEAIVGQAREHSTELMFALAADRLPAAAVTAGSALYVTSLFAGMLSFHHVCARYLFALGREGLAPARLATTSARSAAPVAGSAAQTSLALLVVALFAVTGWDPVTYLFFWGASGGALGVLLLVTATSWAVVGYFMRVPAPSHGRWRTAVAPGAAAVVLGWVLVLTLASFPVVLGAPPDSPAPWLIPGAYLVVVLAGLCWGVVLRTRYPDAYARIGMGARSATISRTEELIDAR
ncbi:APC family permease [Saccharopolyspora sp. MS10]|uniref:APC family permease n=1 Tax=Saccharopolyspora sp. MS10 TaxID=3385973 RepID=UPI00399EEEEE